MITFLMAELLLISSAFAQEKRPLVTEKRLGQCYKEFPFIYKAITDLSDEDRAKIGEQFSQ